MNMQQPDFFNTTTNQPELVKIPDGEYTYIPNFFDKIESGRFFSILRWYISY